MKTSLKFLSSHFDYDIKYNTPALILCPACGEHTLYVHWTSYLPRCYVWMACQTCGSCGESDEWVDALLSKTPINNIHTKLARIWNACRTNMKMLKDTECAKELLIDKGYLFDRLTENDIGLTETKLFEAFLQSELGDRRNYIGANMNKPTKTDAKNKLSLVLPQYQRRGLINGFHLLTMKKNMRLTNLLRDIGYLYLGDYSAVVDKLYVVGSIEHALQMRSAILDMGGSSHVMYMRTYNMCGKDKLFNIHLACKPGEIIVIGKAANMVEFIRCLRIKRNVLKYAPENIPDGAELMALIRNPQELCITLPAFDYLPLSKSYNESEPLF